MTLKKLRAEEAEHIRVLELNMDRRDIGIDTYIRIANKYAKLRRECEK